MFSKSTLIRSMFILVVMPTLFFYFQSCGQMGSSLISGSSSGIEAPSLLSQNPQTPQIVSSHLTCENYHCVSVTATDLGEKVGVKFYAVDNPKQLLSQLSGDQTQVFPASASDSYAKLQFEIPEDLLVTFKSKGLSLRISNEVATGHLTLRPILESNSMTVYGLPIRNDQQIPRVLEWAYSCADGRCLDLRVNYLDADIQLEIWSGVKHTSQLLLSLSKSQYLVTTNLNQIKVNWDLPPDLFEEYETKGLRLKLIASDGQSSEQLLRGIPEPFESHKNPVIQDLLFSCPDLSCVRVTGSNFNRNIFVVLTSLDGLSFKDLGIIRFPNLKFKLNRGFHQLTFTIPKPLRAILKSNSEGFQFVFINPQSSGNFSTVASVQIPMTMQRNYPIRISKPNFSSTDRLRIVSQLVNVPIYSKLKIEVFEGAGIGSDLPLSSVPVLELSESQLEWSYSMAPGSRSGGIDRGQVLISFQISESLRQSLGVKGFALRVSRPDLSATSVSDLAMYYALDDSDLLTDFNIDSVTVGCTNRPSFCVTVKGTSLNPNLRLNFRDNITAGSIYTGDDFQGPNRNYIKFMKDPNVSNGSIMSFYLTPFMSQTIVRQYLKLEVINNPNSESPRSQIHRLFRASPTYTYSSVNDWPKIIFAGYAGKCGLKNCIWVEGSGFAPDMKLDLYAEATGSSGITQRSGDDLSYYIFNNRRGFNVEINERLTAAFKANGLTITVTNPNGVQTERSHSYTLYERFSF